jgi:hypothetical protein
VIECIYSVEIKEFYLSERVSCLWSVVCWFLKKGIVAYRHENGCRSIYHSFNIAVVLFEKQRAASRNRYHALTFYIEAEKKFPDFFF